MEQQFFDSEAFEVMLSNLKRLSSEQHPNNQMAAQNHNQAYQLGGDKLVSTVPDVVLPSKHEEIGRTVIEFLCTIPGIKTQHLLETVSKPDAIALTDRALSVYLRGSHRETAKVSLSLIFASEMETYHRLELERIDSAQKRVAVGIDIDTDRIPVGGRIKIGEKSNGQFVINRTTIEFDHESRVITGVPEYGLNPGDQLNIINLLSQITTPEGMDESLNPQEILNKARVPLLSAQTD